MRSSDLTAAQETATGNTPVGCGSFLSDRPAFEQRLAGLLSESGGPRNLVVGKIHMIDMAEVRQRLGEQWPRLADKVHRTIRRTLENRLGPGDFYTHYEEETYVVVFGRGSEDEAKLKMALLAEEIMAKIFGMAEARSASRVAVRTLVQTADGSLSGRTLEGLSQITEIFGERTIPTSGEDAAALQDATEASIADLLGAAERQFARHRAAPTTRPDPNAPDDRLIELARQLHNIEQALNLITEDAPKCAASRWSPLVASSLADGLSDLLRQVEENLPKDWNKGHRAAKEALDKLLAHDEAAMTNKSDDPSVQSAPVDPVQSGVPGPDESELPDEVIFDYLPVRQVGSGTIGIYQARVTFDFAGQRRTADALISAEHEPQLLSLLDRVLLQRVANDLEQALAAGARNLILMPVHPHTLSHPAASSRYLSICRTLPEAIRSLIVYELVGLPPESWGWQLPSLVAALKPFGKAIALRAPNDASNFADLLRRFHLLHAAGVGSVGLSAQAAQTPEAELIRRFDRFVEAAGKLRLPAYLIEVSSFSLLTAASCAGFRQVGGEVLGEVAQRPLGLHTTELEEIYRRNTCA